MTGAATGRLAGRVALVTGAGRGIGRAVALALASEGAAIAGAARTKAQVEETAVAVRALGARAAAYVADVGRASDVADLVTAAEQDLGPVDVLINNAGIVARGAIEETTPETWDAVFTTNLRGAYLCARAVVPGMRRRGGGRIVNVSSISGRLGTARLTAYCASKWGLVGLTKALAEEVRSDGIQVNVVCPGSVATEMLAQGLPGAKPVMSPEDVAKVVLYLAADAPDAVTGSVVDVFG